MEIDKTIGKWYNGSTLLEDYTYYLYLNYFKVFFEISNYTMISRQLEVCKYKHDEYLRFYDEAKQILRKEKIEKILSRGNK